MVLLLMLNNPMSLVDVDGHGFRAKLGPWFAKNCFCEGEQLEARRKEIRETNERELVALRNNNDY